MNMTGDEGSSSSKGSTTQKLAQALPNLTPEQVAEVSPKFVRETYTPGEVIIRQGEPANRFYIVIRGQAMVLHEDLSGQVGKVDVREPGEYFGETGLLQNRPRNATVRASTDGETEVLAMDREAFEEMIDESKATEMHVAQEMIQRLIQLASAQS